MDVLATSTSAELFYSEESGVCNSSSIMSMTRVQVTLDAIITCIDVLLGIWIIVSNLFVYFVLNKTVLKAKRERTAIDLHITSLIFSDLVKGLFTVPLDEVMPWIKVGSEWCHFVYYVGAASGFVQPFVLIILAVDRYWAVVHPLHYRIHVDLELTRWIVLAPWMIPVIGITAFFFRIYQTDPCVLEHPCINPYEIFNPFFVAVLSVVLLVPPNIFIPFLYYRTYRDAVKVIKRHENKHVTLFSKVSPNMEPQSSDLQEAQSPTIILKKYSMRKIRNTLLLSTTVFLYLISWITIVIFMAILQRIGHITTLQFHVLTFLNHINSAFNPFIFVLSTVDRKKEAWNLFQKMQFWKSFSQEQK